MREQILKWVEAENLSVRELSRRTGISRTTLSRWLKGEENERVEKALLDFLSRNGKPEPFIETRTVRVIWEVLEQCYAEREIGVILGDAGVGKTTALREWVKRNPLKGLLVTVTVAHTGRELLADIAERVGVYPRGNSHRILQEITAILRDDPRLLIVDEADLLNERSLELLRAIHDLSGTGMVLSGMVRLFVKMTRGADMMQNLAQLYSRVGYKVFLKGVTHEDIDRVIEAYGLEADLANDLYKIGQKVGMRGVIKAVKRGKRLAVLNQRPLDRRLIQTAAKALLMGLEGIGG